MEQNLSQEQKLQQRLNPQQVMFGRLLEMTAPEIEDEVRRELDDNPALELAPAESDLPEKDDDFKESAEDLQMADYGSTDDIPFYSESPRGRRRADGSFDPMSIAAASPADEDSLIAGMEQRLAELNLNPEQKTIADYIIGNLDSNGYLPRTLSAIASDIALREGFNPPIEEVREVFRQIRTLDPPGIAAVDLRDCLLLQLDRMEGSLPQRVAREIIARNFDLFSKKHFDKLRARLGIDADTLQEALELIRTLNPKPGALLGGSNADRMVHISPDLAVERFGDTGFTVSLLNRTPELTISESFAIPQADPADASRNPEVARRRREAGAFIRRKHDDAATFIKMLSARASTLVEVMKAIVAHQHPFFTSGNVSEIRPMILKDIAATTGLDLSVISRATAGKYVLTAHGIFPLKLFFNERPKAENDTSTHEIMEALRKIIEEEDKSHPLSDEALKDRLVGQGYDIARRTVAKYRERLGFPVGRLRKNF